MYSDHFTRENEVADEQLAPGRDRRISPRRLPRRYQICVLLVLVLFGLHLLTAGSGAGKGTILSTQHASPGHASVQTSLAARPGMTPAVGMGAGASSSKRTGATAQAALCLNPLDVTCWLQNAAQWVAQQITSALPKTPGAGKQLYHLSNPGLHLLARNLDRPARELARRWQADEAGLLRLLPRLPTLLMLQEVVNGLITGAAEAMTTQGRRPRLVRWNWQREVTYRFQYREQSMRFFADGVVALCVRIQQSESSTMDKWFGLFLLSTDLDDERLMRLRIERLLCWRECPEHWPSYQHMLLVLILARSPRQRDHWQRAVEATALKLRLDPLAGALACLPPGESTHVNPWLLKWRTLATDESCHLQDLLKPLPHAAFPPSLWLEEGEEESNTRSPSSASAATVSSGTPTRLGRLLVWNLDERAAQVAQGELEEREVIALLGLRLTPCQWNILRLLLAHPLLSDEELADFLDIQRRSVRCSLYELHQLECLAPIATEVGKRWHFCGRGSRLIAATSRLHIGNIATMSDDAAKRETSTLLQRGEAWLLQRIQHTAGIYGFFTRLTQAARREPEQALCWWETGVVCERRYRVGEQWYNLKPDALAEYRVGSQQMRFWLEWDRGTMNVRDLAIKFTSYASYIASVSGQENARCCQCSFVLRQISRRRSACNVWLGPDSRIPLDG